MSLIWKIAEKSEVKQIQNFFKKYLDKTNSWIMNEEFLCPFWIKWAVNRGQIVILKYKKEIVWALRFYPRKRDNMVSVYQFALQEDFRWKLLIRKMLEKTWYKTFESSCLEESKFNEYYRKTWWKIKNNDNNINYWILEI